MHARKARTFGLAARREDYLVAFRADSILGGRAAGRIAGSPVDRSVTARAVAPRSRAGA